MHSDKTSPHHKNRRNKLKFKKLKKKTNYINKVFGNEPQPTA
jgi:hypothetical protein